MLSKLLLKRFSSGERSCSGYLKKGSRFEALMRSGKLFQIYNWLSKLEASYPGVASVINAGKSYEGRDMKGIKIKFGENNPVVMLESGKKTTRRGNHDSL